MSCYYASVQESSDVVYLMLKVGFRGQLMGQMTGDQEVWGLIPDTGHE